MMPMSLQALQASLVNYHFATPAQPLPVQHNGITWIVAQNGIWKRGVDAERDFLICVHPGETCIPGLVSLVPHARFRQTGLPLPAAILTGILVNARKAKEQDQLIEQQYHILLDHGLLRVRIPKQQASSHRVVYEMPDGVVILDLHSHHSMPAYFSATDDRDDLGLSISAVIGHITLDQPEIVIRLNVFGHHQSIPALLVFERLGVFRDVSEVVYAKP